MTPTNNKKLHKVFAISFSYNEPFYGTIIVPANDEQEAANVVLGMLKNTIQPTLVDTKDVSDVPAFNGQLLLEDHNKQIETSSEPSNVVSFKKDIH